jgi:multicomponent Na+:H+ antiporter subunit G
MIVLQWARFGLAALLMLAGLVTLFATVVGLFRFHHVLNRIHAAAKCDTFGVLLIFSSLIVMTGWDVKSLKLLLIIAFLWISNPVSGHLIAYLEVATNPNIRDECEVIRYDAG